MAGYAKCDKKQKGGQRTVVVALGNGMQDPYDGVSPGQDFWPTSGGSEMGTNSSRRDESDGNFREASEQSLLIILCNIILDLFTSTP